ncbi:hypothetical protein N781_17030 [Pontibacillus halophilus JSM 076056 = DSM 19796]|uniref:Uncharacterized protein n=1 Tax=Pontibacillus halophilus JSM 076056 = DSM 19796 TaxID=1385510 RepID=A0A0A5GMU0_9BACI|nr:hypothetical protein [Pontibacillus halophilus]KGX92518.1 hypothetical protein N781_17030 [Pontibacillus halophilus JSM 076056 = DSM 19796]
MSEWYVVGAQQKNGVLKDWQQYKKGVIVKVNSQNGKVTPCVEYTSPRRVVAEEKPSYSFTAATVEGGHMYVPTTTEVLVYELPSFNRVHYVSLPRFNDVHHVRPLRNGNLLVVNTGLEMVVEMNKIGQVVREWNVLGVDPWKWFDPNVDYRKVPSTKPHVSHPNYGVEMNGEIWVTRCLQHDLACVDDPTKTIPVGTTYIHDGIHYGDHLYFTQTDGKVITIRKSGMNERQVYDLNEFEGHQRELGWCRGIEVINPQEIIVAFTRIRPKKIKQNGVWVWDGDYGKEPTRIACYHLGERKLKWEMPLETYGLNAIYSVHRV